MVPNCDGDVEVGFTLHENARTHATEFVSDGEVTENFVRLLAKLFGKDFPVKKTAKKLKIDGFYLEDVRDDDYCDENGVFMAKCFVGNDVQDEEDEADILANIELLAKVIRQHQHVQRQKYPTYLENFFSAELATVTKRFFHWLSTDEHFYATSLSHEPALFPFCLNSSSIHHKYQFVPQ